MTMYKIYAYKWQAQSTNTYTAVSLAFDVEPSYILIFRLI